MKETKTPWHCDVLGSLDFVSVMFNDGCTISVHPLLG